MKFESKRQKVAGVPHFLFRMFSYAMFCFLLIILSIAIGVVGYHFIGGVNFIDSFHMSCMILTGMGPVVEMKTAAAKTFSSSSCMEQIRHSELGYNCFILTI